MITKTNKQPQKTQHTALTLPQMTPSMTTGKSSLISSYVSRIFSPVPPTLIPVLTPPTAATPSCTILDTSTSNLPPLTTSKNLSVILCYDSSTSQTSLPQALSRCPPLPPSPPPR